MGELDQATHAPAFAPCHPATLNCCQTLSRVSSPVEQGADMSETESDEPMRATVAGGRVDLGRFLLSWFAVPSALIIALLLGAAMMLALGANPLTGYSALVTGALSLIHISEPTRRT